jgi:uncharacterized protein (TIRG00374 family)
VGVKKHWKSVAQYGLGLGLLALVVAMNWSDTTDKTGQTSPGLATTLQKPVQFGPLFISALVCALSMIITFYRWFLLVRALNLPFTFHDALRLGLIGYYFNTFLPGSVGGDILKAAFIAREQKGRRTAAVATVLIDRVVGLWALVWLVAILGVAFWLADSPIFHDTAKLHAGERLQALVVYSVAIAVASVFVWGLLGLLPERRAQRFAGRLESVPRAGHSLAEMWRAVWMYRQQSKAVFASIGLSLVSHTGFVLTFFYAVQTFPAEPGDLPSLTEHCLIVPVGLTVQALSPTPGGAGFGELGFGGMYNLIGYKFAKGVEGSLVQRVVSWVLGLVGLIVYLRLRGQMPTAQEKHAIEEELLGGPGVTDDDKAPPGPT